MTKYRLKDQELQKKLDEITDGDFSECLEKGAVDQFCRVGSIGVTCGRFGCNGHPRLKIDFYLHEYEELKEYNPKRLEQLPRHDATGKHSNESRIHLERWSSRQVLWGVPEWCLVEFRRS